AGTAAERRSDLGPPAGPIGRDQPSAASERRPDLRQPARSAGQRQSTTTSGVEPRRWWRLASRTDPAVQRATAVAPVALAGAAARRRAVAAARSAAVVRAAAVVVAPDPLGAREQLEPAREPPLTRGT